MQADAIKPGQNVVVVDDLIATGSQQHPATPLLWRADHHYKVVPQRQQENSSGSSVETSSNTCSLLN